MDAERKGFPYGRGVASPDLEGPSPRMEDGARHILDGGLLGEFAAPVEFGALVGP